MNFRFQNDFVLFALCSLLIAFGCSQHDGTESDVATESNTASAAEETQIAAQAANQPESQEDHAPEKQKQKHSNRLVNESSLYLQMHAHNPIDWFPWGEEAFAKAKKEDKLIFLSVGYSSCYWCHVMERESFMDEEIAKFMNANYVCIKVDREERPDVDSIYMMAVQLRTGRGGWPMSVFITPDAKPFFGGTYFPARTGDRGNSPGFFSLAQEINRIWKSNKEGILKDANIVTEEVKKRMVASAKLTELNESIISSVKQSLADEFDSTYGGFGFSEIEPQRPKFPEPSNLLFLAELAKAGDEDAKKMFVTTLERMHMGGIWDHVGGGFHRYSTDRFWKIPHFEKMLYDNGQLLSVYALGFDLTQREDFKRVVKRTVEYMNRELLAQEGAYFAAMDAESEKIEGKFYRWQKEDIQKVLGDQFEFFATIYGLNQEPNFEHEFYVPQLDAPWSEKANSQNSTELELDAKLQPLRAKLLEIRDKRPRPLRDNKILTAWNGLAIRGLADAGRMLKDDAMIQSAQKAANFVLKNLKDKNGRLKRTFTDGKASLNAYLDDYAFFVNGLIALHKATQDDRWLNEADQLTAKQIELFWDTEGKAFFFTSNDHETLIARSKSFTDTVRPAGNSVAVENLQYLAEHREHPEYEQMATDTMKSAATLIGQLPNIATRMAVSIQGEFK